MCCNGKNVGSIGARLTLFWILAPTFISCAVFNKVLSSSLVKMEANLPCSVFNEDYMKLSLKLHIVGAINFSLPILLLNFLPK